jgi:UTP--glucose-1-phosphate uridylyltransferase
MARLIGSQPFHGVRFEGDRFDCGDKVGFIAANLAYGLDRPDLSAALREAVSRYL